MRFALAEVVSDTNGAVANYRDGEYFLTMSACIPNVDIGSGKANDLLFEKEADADYLAGPDWGSGS